LDLRPMTLEGCVVRMADTISYIGRDIEDAIRLGLIRREDIPVNCREVLGDTNGKIVYALVEDLVANSLDREDLSFSAHVGSALKELKEFNEKRIYQDSRVKGETAKIRRMFALLFEKYLEDLETGNQGSVIYRGFLEGMSGKYLEKTPPAGIVRDFIAGMTDEYFLDQCRRNFFPETSPDFF